MAHKINNNHGQWWRASEKAWTTWARATRYQDAGAAERAYERLDAAGVRPVGIFPASGEPAWSRNGALQSSAKPTAASALAKLSLADQYAIAESDLTGGAGFADDDA